MTRGRTPRLTDPLVALLVVNGHTKRLAGELDAARQAGRGRRVAALLRERAYLYTLKDRAIRVLLDTGRLVPVRVDDQGLLVEGRSPLGVLGFHAPLAGFEAEARGVPREKAWVPGTLVRARVAVSRYRLEDAIMLLTRLITQARLQRRHRRHPAGDGRPEV